MNGWDSLSGIIKIKCTMYGILCNNKVMLGIDLCDECEKKKHMIKSVEIIIPKVNEEEE